MTISACDSVQTPDPAMSEDVRKCPIPADGLNEKQRAAIELMILGKKLSDISQSLEIDPRTLYRWRKEERFIEELHRRRSELWSRAAQRLSTLVHPSLDVLESHLDDRYEHIRFRAAATVLRLVDLKKLVCVDDD